MAAESDVSGAFGFLLKAFRKRKHVTQEQLARAVGVHRNAIGRWEQGEVLPASKGMVLEIARHLHLDDQATRQLLEASLTALTPHWSIPFPRNPFFTGREEVLEALYAHLGSGQAVALTQSSALHGLGGVGKTQIALEYAYRHALEYRAVFWIGAETEESIVTSLLHIAETLGVPEREDKDQQRVIAAVQRWLSTHDQWLLIWDNVEDLDLLHRFLPVTRSGAILLTTRSQALGTLAQGLDLRSMEQEEALLFLLRRAKVLAPGATSEHMQQFAERAPIQYTAAAELVSELGGLPLALDQAGAYVEETQCGLPAYLERFRTRRTALLQQRGERAQNHPASVSTTFTLALTATARRHPAVWDLLHVCALLSPDAIPEELFRQGGEVLGAVLAAVCRDVLEWDRIVSAACSSSLLSRQSEAQTLSLHRLVQAVVLDGMTEAQRQQWLTRAISALEAVFPDVLTETNYTAWQQGERLLSHALLCLHPIRAHDQSLTFASLAYKAAQYLQERGWYTEAESLYQRALHAQEQTLGPDDPAVASSLQGLANLYCLQDRVAEAEPLYQRALSVREQALGPTHSLVATALVGLAEFYLQQDQYEEAEPLYQRALQIWEHVLSPDHPLVAYALNGLAILLREQGRFVEAAPLLQRALRIREQALGSTHPLVASVLTNLALLLQQQGNVSEAEPLFRRALRIREQALGSTHLQVAYPLHGLALLLQQQGNVSEAEPLFQRALSIREAQLGAQHPDRAHTLHDLAILKRQQGKLREARSLAQQALSIRARSLGDTHPKTADTRTLYEQLLRQQAGDQEETPAAGSREAQNGIKGSPPDRAETEGAACEDDPLQAFLRACCELHPRAWCRSADLWQAYQQWREEHQERYPLSRGAFIAQLKAHGCRADRTMTTRIWRGIALVKKEA